MKTTLLVALALVVQSIFSAAQSATITGTVTDSLLQQPVEYANIVLGNYETQEQITGTTSGKDGTFVLSNIKPGEYLLVANFIGYYPKTVEPIAINDNNQKVDIGSLSLLQSVIELSGVEATAERAAVEYQIDKKVINVGKQYTAASGSAIDVLENVPSVTVDIEGNVALRGSSSFRVLIDGRPTILDNSDALRQIPASSIENIEIITNPSAKYDPDGTSGILNIITKKNTLNGVNGLVNVNAGVNKKYGADVLLNYRMPKFNVYVGGNFNSRYFPGTAEQISRTLRNDTTYFVNSIGEMSRQFEMYGLQSGFDWNITDNDLLGVGLRYSDRTFSIQDETDYYERQNPGASTNEYISLSEMQRGGADVSIQANYRHQFEKRGHELTAEADYERERDTGDNTDELFSLQGELQSGRRAVEKGPEQQLRLKLDYTLPLREKDRFEAGYQSRISASSETNELYEYRPSTENYKFLDEYSHTTEYDRSIHSLYSLYAAQLGRLGFQGGLRGEYTYRQVALVGENENSTIDRLDYFPTLHASFELAQNQQTMASYTRRIERPRGYYFEPFITWMDAYNVRRGNPGILPEYIDSYEASYQRNVGKSLFSLEGYYRITHNKIERVQSVYSETVMLHTVDNVGEDYTLGAEMMLNMDTFKWWNVNLMGNLYRYRIEGVIDNELFSRSSRNWDIRFNNTFNLTSSSRLQINMSYNSPSVSAQGRREGYFATNVAMRQTFLQDKLEVILQARDIFATAKYQFTAEGANFYRESRFTREAPVYTVTLNYSINNYKRQRQGGENMGGGDGGFEEM